MDAIKLIAAERRRQVDEEGYTPEHDDLHNEGQLAFAACYYAMPHMLMRRCDGRPCPVTPDYFFKETGWDKASDKRGFNTPLRNVIIAAALLAADADRRIRLGEPL